MAYPLVHLLIADAFAAFLPALRQSGPFFLGAVAPDAIHMRQGAQPMPHKFDTHLKARGEDGLQEVMGYWYEAGRQPFHLGYGLHVITDRLWVGFYRGAYPQLLEPDGRTRTALYRADADWIDRALLYTLPERPAFLNLLARAPAPASHPLLTAGEIDAWRRSLLLAFDSVTAMPQGSPFAMTLPEVWGFIDRAVARLRELLGDWGAQSGSWGPAPFSPHKESAPHPD